MIFTLLCFLVSLVLLGADLITKWIASSMHFAQNGFFLGIVRLYYTENTGIAFSIAGDSPAAMAVITVFTVLLIGVIAALFFWLGRSGDKWNRPIRVLLMVIEAGALGNLIDRLCLGYVRDFVDLSAFKPLAWLGSDFNFGICNLADFYITFSAAILLFCLLFIGPRAAFPLKKSWREEGKRMDAAREAKRKAKAGLPAEAPAGAEESAPAQDPPAEGGSSGDGGEGKDGA